MKMNVPIEHQLLVLLDGQPVSIPPEMQTFKAIYSRLNSLALQQQRIVSALSMEVESVNCLAASPRQKPLCRITATTTNMEHLHLHIVHTALQQVEQVRELVQDAVVDVQINEGCLSHARWRELAESLQEPLVTLSALPEAACGPPGTNANQLRKWQFEQLTAVRNDVDEACRRNNATSLLYALENRVLAWLNSLRDMLSLWRETLLLECRLTTVA